MRLPDCFRTFKGQLGALTIFGSNRAGGQWRGDDGRTPGRPRSARERREPTGGPRGRPGAGSRRGRVTTGRGPSAGGGRRDGQAAAGQLRPAWSGDGGPESPFRTGGDASKWNGQHPGGRSGRGPGTPGRTGRGGTRRRGRCRAGRHRPAMDSPFRTPARRSSPTHRGMPTPAVASTPPRGGDRPGRPRCGGGDRVGRARDGGSAGACVRVGEYVGRAVAPHPADAPDDPDERHRADRNPAPTGPEYHPRGLAANPVR
jgi:hypothetical protein